MRFVFNRDDLTQSSWVLKDERADSVHASCNALIDGQPVTSCIMLKRVGQTLQFNSGSSSLLHAEMRRIFAKTKTRYLEVL